MVALVQKQTYLVLVSLAVSALVYHELKSRPVRQARRKQERTWVTSAKIKMYILEHLFVALTKVDVADTKMPMIEADSGSDVLGKKLWDRYIKLVDEFEVLRGGPWLKSVFKSSRKSEKEREEWIRQLEELSEELKNLKTQRFAYIVAFKLHNDGLILVDHYLEGSRVKGILLQNFMPELLDIADGLVRMLLARGVCELPPIFNCIAQLCMDIIAEHESYWMKGRVGDLQYAVRAVKTASQICGFDHENVPPPEMQADFVKAEQVHTEVTVSDPPLPEPGAVHFPLDFRRARKTFLALPQIILGSTAVQQLDNGVRAKNLSEFWKQVVKLSRPPLQQYPDFNRPDPHGLAYQGRFYSVYSPQVAVDPDEGTDLVDPEGPNGQMTIFAKLPVDPWAFKTRPTREEVDFLREEIDLRFLLELKIWANISHPNILPLTGFAFCRQFTHVSQNKLLPALISRQTAIPLRHFLSEEEENMEVLPGKGAIMRLKLLLEIASALEYMHYRPEGRLAHGNLCDASVLITPSKSAMLCDFGLSKMVDEWETPEQILGHRMDFVSYSFSPPETLWGLYDVGPSSGRCSKPTKERSDPNQEIPERKEWRSIRGTDRTRPPIPLTPLCNAPECDVYSFGMVAIKILTNKAPWDESLVRLTSNMPRSDYYRQPYTPRLWLVREPFARAMLARCMHPQPEKRLTMRTVKRFIEVWMEKTMREVEEMQSGKISQVEPLADPWTYEKDKRRGWNWSR